MSRARFVTEQIEMGSNNRFVLVAFATHAVVSDYKEQNKNYVLFSGQVCLSRRV
jgi:hypothetical protein